MAGFYRVLVLLVVTFAVLAAGLNNLNQQHPSKTCSEHGNEADCLTYAACQVNSGGSCVHNSDVNYDKFKLLVTLPLSARNSGGSRQISTAVERMYSILVGTVAAIEDVNNRDGSVVPQLSSLACNFDFHYDVLDAVIYFEWIVFVSVNYTATVDTQASPSFASSDLTHAFLQEGTFGEYDYIIGDVSDDATLPLSILSHVHNVPMISPISSRQDLDDKATYPSFARASPVVHAFAKATAGYLESMQYSQAAVLYGDSRSGRDFKNALVAASKKSGVVLQEFETPEDPGFISSSQSLSLSALDNALHGIAASKLNIVVCALPVSALLQTLTRADQMGLIAEGKLWIFAGDEDTLALEDLLVSEPEIARLLNGQLRVVNTVASSSDSAFSALKSKWSGLMTTKPSLESRLPGGANQLPYVSNDGLVFRIDDALYESTERCTVEAALAYDATVAAAMALCKADQEGLDLKRALHGRATQLYQILGGLSFVGASGAFRLLQDTGSRDPATVGFELENFRYAVNRSRSQLGYEVSRNSVGQWIPENQTWSLDLAAIRYHPGDVTTAPLITDPIEPQPLRVSQSATSLIHMLGGFMLASIVVLACWICQKNNEHDAKASQPVILMLVLIGMLLSSFGVLFVGDDLFYATQRDFVSSCQVAWWLWSCGTTLSASAILAKLCWIYKTHLNAKTKITSSEVNTMHLWMGVLGCMLVDVLLLSMWTAINPWAMREVGYGPTDSFGRSEQVYATCTGLKGAGASDGGVLAMLILAFHVGIYALGAFISWKVRHVYKEFPEAFRLGVCFVLQLQLLVLGISNGLCSRLQ